MSLSRKALLRVTPPLSSRYLSVLSSQVAAVLSSRFWYVTRGHHQHHSTLLPSSYDSGGANSLPPKLCPLIGDSFVYHPPTSTSRYGVLVDRWKVLLSSHLPKGFEKFTNPRPTPRQKEEEKEEDDKPTTTTQGSSSSKKEDDGHTTEQDRKDNTPRPSRPRSSSTGGDGGGSSGSGKKPQPPSQGINSIQTGLAVGFLLYLMYSAATTEVSTGDLSFQDFLNEFFLKGYVDHIEIVNKSIARVYIRPDAPAPYSGQRYTIQLGSVEHFENKLEQIQAGLGLSVQEYTPVMYITERDGADEFFKILPSILMLIPIILAARLMMGSGGMMGGSGSSSGGRNIFQLGKAFPQGTKDLRVKTRFSDVAGLTQAKQEVVEFVDFLREPSKFEHLGARIPKGGLLVGPPGTGKTLLAKAVAGESGVPFFSMSGSDFIEMFVGVGPSRVRDLFAQARQAAPSIIFIDEIDAVGRKRGKGGFSGGANDERENTLNQILVEMDGFSSTTGVVVLAGTNRADILDPALIRPGRFDRQIAVDKPDLNDREAIFKVHLKPLTLLKGIDVTEVARRMAALTPGMTGADIANLCNEAAIYAARRSSSGVEMKDFEAATERIIGGLAKSNNLMSEQEKRTVAIHESGHAVAGWMMEFADPLLKVTIVPRSSGALGFAQYLPEELALYSKEALHDKLAVILGGRAAEELFTGRITTGAADDFAKATNIALGMAQVYGMTEGVGLLSWNPQQMQEMMYKPFSEKTAQTIESEARKIVENQYKRVKELLKANEAKVKALSVELFTKETLVFNDLQDVLGPRPYGINDKYLKYIDTRAGVEKDRQEAATATTSKEEQEVHLNENSGIPMGEAKEQQPLTEASGIHHHHQQEEKEEGGGTQSSRTDDNHR